MDMSVFLLCLFAIGLKEHFMVTMADQSFFAREGEDVILNCSVDSHVPVSEIEEVTWKRTVRDQDIIVLLYQDSEIFPDASHELYRGRVDLFSSEIHKGNFSLKLMDVQKEDKGEYVCEVHTRNVSAHTIVVLQSVGLPAVFIVILVFCLIALLVPVGFCGPVFNLLRKKDTTQKAMKIHMSLILCPNICMFIAFCLWSTEGFLSEVITCSTVSIMRPLILMKTSSYLERLPQFLQKAVMVLTFPLYQSSLALGACLSIYGLQVYLIVCLEAINSVLLALIVRSTGSPFGLEYEMLLPCLIVGIMIVLSLQRHFFLGKPFKCVDITVSSIVMTIFSLYGISLYILLSVALKDFRRCWTFLFEIVIFLLVWSGMIYLLRCHRGQKQGCCHQWKKIGYLCCIVIVAVLITIHGALCFFCLYLIIDVKDRVGSLALTPLLHVLVATCFCKHPKVSPDFLHIVIYMFGAVGLSIVNAIALATELILKEEGGAQNTDLRLIVLPFEIVFLFAWLTLQVYNAWTGFKDRAKNEFGRRSEPEVAEMSEMQILSDPNPD
ncbi:uncharacterized protein Hap1MRO34_010118 isoform 2-T2 [Clarias gariepinus]